MTGARTIALSPSKSLQFNDKYRRLFSPTDFDLLIDEAHCHKQPLLRVLHGTSSTTATPKDS